MKKALHLFNLVLAFVSLSNVGLSQNCIDSSLIDPTMICFSVYAPVCGCDGVTYDNDCVATHWGGVTSFTPGPCAVSGNDCIDSTLINEDAACMDLYDPVCGCDSVTYSNSCYAVNFGGVTSYTSGPCNNGGVIIADPCMDLFLVDFGDCDMALGFGVINGQCASISGCGWIVDNIDYSLSLFPNLSDCQSCLGTEPINAEPCSDLSGIDFGACSMPLGIGIVNNACVSISGCGFVVNNVNYSNAFYPTMEACELCLGSNGITPMDETPFALYPNPTKDFITIRMQEEAYFHVDIINLEGQVLLAKQSSGIQVMQLDLSPLSAGIYLVRIQSEHSIQVARVVVED